MQQEGTERREETTRAIMGIKSEHNLGDFGVGRLSYVLHPVTRAQVAAGIHPYMPESS